MLGGGRGTEEDSFVGVFHELVEVGLLAGEADGADEFDEAVVVDKDAAGVHVPDLCVVLLELGPGPDQVVKQVPDLGLQEVAVDLLPVLDLHLEDVGVVVVPELSGGRGTFTTPLDPHIAVVS